MFKFIGFIAGYYFYGFFGALAGLFIGSVIDRARAYGPGAINPMQNALRQTVFIETLFLSMGKLAKADDRVSEDEVAHVEMVMQKLGMTVEHRVQAIALFKRGTDPAFDVAATCNRFMAVCGQTRNLTQLLLVYLIIMAAADGRFDSAEKATLGDIAARLGYDSTAFEHLMGMVLSQSHFSAGQPVNSAAALDDAYKTLGVTAGNSDAEIKHAYRKLISQYHPDKLIGQGLPEDMVAMATEQAKGIQLAYDLIKKHRNI